MKLVNATKLDNDLTNIADLLRERGVGVGSFSFPNDFISNMSNLITVEEFVCTQYQRPIYINSTSIPARAFSFSDITEIHGPNVTTFETISFPTLAGYNNIDGSQFAYCKNLTIIDLPNLITTSPSCFKYDTSLTDAYLPKAQLKSSCFSNCSNLITVCADSCIAVPFANNSALKAVEFLNSFDQISGGMFSGSTNFDTLILRSTTLIPLGNINAFNGYSTSLATKFASNKAGGILYVPESLIDSYTIDTNWSTILNYTNNQILPIEGSIYETQHVNGILIGG